MARIARVVIPNYPHHIIHRGNRREKVFFNRNDKQAYIDFLAQNAEDYPWSSARAHVDKKQDRLLSDSFVTEEINDWKGCLSDDSDDKKGNLFVRHVDTGRPLGDKDFIKKIETVVGRKLRRRKPGPRKRKN